MTTHSMARADINPLTGFRFVAAMMVFFSHYAIPGVSGTGLRIAQSGYAGVTLFFVLSGFIIAYNYLDQFEARVEPGAVRRFLLARFARVYPLYLFFIVFGSLTAGAGAPPWAHLLAIQTWSADSEFAFSINGPAWSIGVEVFFYLMFPLLVTFLARTGVLVSLRRVQLAAVLVAAAMLGAAVLFTWTGLNNLVPDEPLSAYRWLFRTPVLRLGDFLLGMLGAVFFMRFAAMDAASVRRWGHATLLCALAILLLMAAKKNFRSAFSWDVAYALPAALLIVGLAINRATWISRLLASAPLLLLGESSYALYLAHVPARPMLQEVALGGTLHQLGVYTMFVLWVIALSVGLHVAIEKPARRWIRGLSRLAPGRARPAEPQAPASRSAAIAPAVTPAQSRPAGRERGRPRRRRAAG
ncbi:MAG: acyltransferase [Ramlibacter sp.]